MEPLWKVPEEVKWERVYYLTAILYITKPKIKKQQQKKKKKKNIKNEFYFL